MGSVGLSFCGLGMNLSLGFRGLGGWGSGVSGLGVSALRVFLR